ncbi:WDR18 family protein [Megaselia abdita]
MSDCVEILFTSESSGTHSTCCAWDPKNGTNLLTYKGGGAATINGIDFIRDEFLITANNTKPLLHIFPVNSQDQISEHRLVIPGKPNTIAISPDGNYLVAGIQETFYVWEIRTGRMVNSISKHYQKINVIRFTDDGSHFVTASEDGGVLVWNFSKVAGDGDSNMLPLYTLHDHALPVTHIHIGIGGLRALMFTVSLDSTCRIYDLSTGKQLLNIVFMEALTCVTANLTETTVFVGTVEGNILEFSLVASPRYKEYHMTKEDYTNNLVSSSKEKSSVKCMSLSLDEETLVSGGDDNNVYIWHISSRQLLRTIPHKGSISNVILKLNNKNMLRPEAKYNLIAGSFKRMIDPKTSTDNEIVEMEVKGFAEDDEVIASSQMISSKSGGEVEGQSSSEVDRLREEVKKLKKANHELFQYSLKNVMDK